MPRPGDEHGSKLIASLQILQRAADPYIRKRTLKETDLSRGIAVLDDGLLREQPAMDLIAGPCDGGHSRDTQALVDKSPARVVDPGYHVRDLEGLPGDSGRENVRVVTAGDRSQGTRLFHSGLT